MGRLIAYLGGVRSGKSRLAEQRFGHLIKGKKLQPAYLATLDSALIQDDSEMKSRLREHKARRPASWKTVEIGKRLAANAGHKAMLLDGLGLWASLRCDEEADGVVAEAAEFAAQARKALAVVVLDEVGLGGVSMSAAGRRFADLNGRVNQALCAAAHEVWRVDAGIAVRIK